MATGFVVDVYREGRFVTSRAVAKDWIKIGRLHSADIMLQDPLVARMHAVVERDAMGLRLVDLGSPEGTWVDDQRVNKHQGIRSGERIRIGGYELTIRDGGGLARRTDPSPRSSVRDDELECRDGSVAAEIMTGLGNTVLDVRHLSARRSKRRFSIALGSLGALLVAGGLTTFAIDASVDWEAHRAAETAAELEGRPMPEEPGTGWGGWGLALALLGLVPLVHGVQGRRSRESHRFTIGEGDAVDFTLSRNERGRWQATELVRVEEDGLVVNLGVGMQAELFCEGRPAALEDRVRTTPEAREVRLGLHERLRVDYEGVTFWIAAVRPGRFVATRASSDRAFWSYNALSFSVLGTLFALSMFAAEDAQAFELDPSELDNRFVGYIHAPEVAPPAEEVTPQADGASEGGDAGKRHPGAEGRAGSRRAEPARRRMTVRRVPQLSPQIARNHAPDQVARQAGILGVIEQQTGHTLASPYASAVYTSGEDDEDLWGNLADREVGEAGRPGGMGLIGAGRGGGGNAEGMVGWTHTGTIGRRGGGGGDGLTYGRGGGGFRERDKAVPRVHVATPGVPPGIDRAMIRRTVRAHINEVRHCYNEGLVADPKLSGRVVVAFNIGSTGKVMTSVVSESSVDDSNVGNCIARAVRRWTFPRMGTAGNVLVRYPFVLSPG